VLKTAQGDPVALNNLAVLYVDELGNVSRGVELAEQAHQLSQAPGIVALFKRGQPKDIQRAAQLLESVREQLTSATSKYHLGAVLLATGNKDEGKRLLQQALAASSDFAEAEDARRLLASSK
jgi:TPR repeat protein